ncbi:MAG: PTS sugar transporter subunit IIC [Clostridia bacterium]|nr:PTS sugar transporter subunit IIC [Clostridia bacterium]
MRKFLNRLFIDGLSGMAQGLFATLIVGTILEQIGVICGGPIGTYLIEMGNVAKLITGAGIGVGVAVKLKATPLTTVSAAVAGMIGAFPARAFTLISVINANTGKFNPGEPLGAFVAAYIAVEIGALISGKTPVDIILTPLSCILAGGAVAMFVGPYISIAMRWIGNIVDVSVTAHPFWFGIVVSVVMGILLTLPISSAAIGITVGMSGLAAGAAAIGCCCNMVGFAVISYRENKTGGLIAQGLGTSMLQMPNIVRRPLIWVPAILSSAILAPVSTMVLKMTNTAIGSGMGSAGLVGQFQAYAAMTAAGTSGTVALLEIIGMHFVAPALLALAIAEGMRKAGWIRPGDLKLEGVNYAKKGARG